MWTREGEGSGDEGVSPGCGRRKKRRTALPSRSVETGMVKLPDTSRGSPSSSSPETGPVPCPHEMFTDTGEIRRATRWWDNCWSVTSRA